MPLLVFIDPFGSGPDVDSTVETILKRQGATATELLVNFSLQAVRRMGARLWEPEGAQGRAKTLDRMDEWLGGDWWRQCFLSEEVNALPKSDRAHEAAVRVASDYRRRGLLHE